MKLDWRGESGPTSPEADFRSAREQASLSGDATSEEGIGGIAECTLKGLGIEW